MKFSNLSNKYYNSGIPELFCFCISIIAGQLNYFSRIGFESNYLLILKSIILSAFLIFSPFAINNIFDKKNNKSFILSKPFIFFICFMIILIFGRISELFNINLNLFVFIIGIISIIFFLFKIKLKGNLFNIISLLFLFIFFSIFILSAYYINNYFNPLYYEKIATGAYSHRDSVWQAAISGILKTYDITSIGIDDIINIPYHSFSHYIFAQFSSLLTTNTFVFYSFLLPIIITPIFLLVFLYTIENLSLLYYNFKLNSEINFNESFFWIFLLVLFSYPLPFFIIPENYNYLASQTYLVGFFLFFLIGSISTIFIYYYTSIGVSKFEIGYFLITTFILFIIISYSKISFVYIVFTIFFYLFFRLSLYKKTLYNIFSFLFLVSLIYIFIDLIHPLMNEYPSNDWKSNHNYIYFIYPSILFLILKLIKFKKNNDLNFVNLFKQKSFLDCEILILLMISLYFIPYQYFKGIQVFVAYIFLLAHYSDLKSLILKNK